MITAPQQAVQLIYEIHEILGAYARGVAAIHISAASPRHQTRGVAAATACSTIPSVRICGSITGAPPPAG